MIKPPCKNCPGRYPGCHDKCPDYQEYNKQQEKIREQRIWDGETGELSFMLSNKRRRNLDRLYQKDRNRKRRKD